MGKENKENKSEKRKDLFKKHAGALGQSEEIEFSARQFEKIWINENREIIEDFMNQLDYISVYVKTIFGFYIYKETIYKGSGSGDDLFFKVRDYYDAKFSFDRTKYYFRIGYNDIPFSKPR